MRRSAALPLVLAFAFACNREKDDDTGVDETDTSGEETDDPSDTSGDTSDTSGDTSDTSDSDSPPPDCSDPGTAAPGTASGYGTCFQGELRCGDVITDTTIGGLEQLNYATYNTWQCLGHAGLSQNYDAPERSYYFQAPTQAEGSATITLTTPGDCRKTMSLREVWASNEAECLTSAHMPTCTAGMAFNNGERLTNMSFGIKHRIIVDGRNGAEGVFTLTVDCNLN